MKLISFITTDGKLINFNPEFLVSINHDSNTNQTTVHILDEPFYTAQDPIDELITSIKESKPLF